MMRKRFIPFQPLTAPTRAFSLIEVLLAIFILGVGVISIASLLPAGMAQQRLSVDDIMGPQVAENALAIIRRKVKADDFGTYEQLAFTSPRYTIPGDWSWSRPMFFREDATLTPPGFPAVEVPKGSISIFPVRPSDVSPASAVTTPQVDAVPWNTVKYPNSASGPEPPLLPFIITQRERYYPTANHLSALNEAVRPQYVWDCMFRRFQGRIEVGIFVYRVTVPGGGLAPNYTVAVDPSANANPPLPVWLNFIDNNGNQTNFDVSAGGAWHPGGADKNLLTLDDNAIIPGREAGSPLNVEDQRQAWQHPRQWLIDQNNNVHRVLGLTREDFNTNAGFVEVELVRPVPQLPPVNVFYVVPELPPNDPNTVTDIWYIPLTDLQGYTLTPVYATVREL